MPTYAPFREEPVFFPEDHQPPRHRGGAGQPRTDYVAVVVLDFGGERLLLLGGQAVDDDLEIWAIGRAGPGRPSPIVVFKPCSIGTAANPLA